MFKKTLAAVAVLGAFAGSAFAANVTLYGVVDEALQYTYQNVQNQGKKNAYGMKAGAQAGNRWGLKGQEELGNGYVAGFVLESGFSGDDGKSAQGGRLFGRAASLYVVSVLLLLVMTVLWLLVWVRFPTSTSTLPWARAGATSLALRVSTTSPSRVVLTTL